MTSILEKLALPEVRELIEVNDRETLCDILNDWEAADIAALLLDLSEEEDVIAFGCLQPELGSRTFEYLERPTQERLLQILPEPELARILNSMSPDDRTALLEGLEPDELERLLTLLNPAEQRVARSLLSYGEGTVGRLMTPDFVTIKKHWTASEVLDHIRRFGKDSETLNVLYVTDDNHHLIDDLRIREILLVPADKRVEDLMNDQFVALQVTDDESSAVEQFRKYDRIALPVVDRRGLLVGIVTVDDVLHLAQEEATRDIQKFGGLEALDEPYLETPLTEMIRKRGVWLVVLFMGQLLTASAMDYFGDEIARALVLALFVPLVISSGGNSGSQAATLIIRALAVGEVKLRDWSRVIKRELVSGLVLGLALGLLGFLRIAVWSTFSDDYGEHWALVGITVGLSLVGIVVWGTISGSMLPFILKRLGVDPATSSAPFVATLVDVTGLIIYFSVAMVVLRNTLLAR